MPEEHKEFLAEYDKRYSRMQGFLLTLLGIVFAAAIATNVPQISAIGSLKTQVNTSCQDINYIKDNSASIKAIDNLIMTFENQTKIMEKFLPGDIQGAIKEFNKVSNNQRAYIILHNSNLRGSKDETIFGK